jgi:hypothetical protein
MKRPISGLICVAIILLFTSCAATYKRVNPPQIKYPVVYKDSLFSYQYDVIRRAGNRKIAKKEVKAYMNVIAVKIHNNTGQPLEYGRNYRIFAGETEASLLGPEITSDIIKQKAGFHFFYLLFLPTTLNTGSNTNTNSTANSSSSFPLGLILGPALALGNFAVAKTANKRFKEELLDYDIERKVIAPGETAYGLITLRDNGKLPLTLRLK